MKMLFGREKSVIPEERNKKGVLIYSKTKYDFFLWIAKYIYIYINYSISYFQNFHVLEYLE